jgi:hypothetical protein
MMWKTRQPANSQACFDALSRVCRLVISEDGSLQVILLGPRLTYEDLAMVIARVSAIEAGPTRQQVTLDFAAIEEIVNPWTAVLALLIGLSRLAHLVCHVHALHGQPRNIADLYRKSSELMWLLDESQAGVERRQLRRAG